VLPRITFLLPRSLVNGSSSDDRKSWRLAAPELERAVAIATQHILSDRAGMLEMLERSELQSPDVRTIIESTSALFRRLENEADSRNCMVEVVDRIELCDDGVRVALKIPVPYSRAGVQTSSILDLSRFVPLKMKRRGVETRIIIAAGNEPPRKVDSALLKAVARARVWFDELASGRVRSLAEIARNEDIGKRYVERLSRLAFVPPVIVEAICQGQQPAELNAETLLNRIDLPLEWPAQRNALGMK
jgi:site-specific DNA recombinase